jgi:hypothetical protein
MTYCLCCHLSCLLVRWSGAAGHGGACCAASKWRQAASGCRQRSESRRRLVVVVVVVAAVCVSGGRFVCVCARVCVGCAGWGVTIYYADQHLLARRNDDDDERRATMEKHEWKRTNRHPRPPTAPHPIPTRASGLGLVRRWTTSLGPWRVAIARCASVILRSCASVVGVAPKRRCCDERRLGEQAPASSPVQDLPQRA